MSQSDKKVLAEGRVVASEVLPRRCFMAKCKQAFKNKYVWSTSNSLEGICPFFRLSRAISKSSLNAPLV